MTRKPLKASKSKPAAKKSASRAKSKPAAKKPAPAKKASSKPEKPLKKAAAPAPPAKAKSKPLAAKPAPKAKAPKAPKVPKAPVPKKRPAPVPTGIAKPGLGHKWACFHCGAKFYDLGKPFPVCPKCEADQRDRPAVVAEPAPAAPQPKRPAMAPMSRFLDDDEVAAPEPPDEFGEAGAETEEPEAAEIDIESLEEPGAVAETDFTEAEEE